MPGKLENSGCPESCTTAACAKNTSSFVIIFAGIGVVFEKQR